MLCLNFLLGAFLLTGSNALPVNMQDVGLDYTASSPVASVAPSSIEIASSVTASPLSYASSIVTLVSGYQPSSYTDDEATDALVDFTSYLASATAAASADRTQAGNVTIPDSLKAEVSAVVAKQNASAVPGAIAAMNQLTPHELTMLENYFRVHPGNSSSPTQAMMVNTDKSVGTDGVQNKFFGLIIGLITRLIGLGAKAGKSAAKAGKHVAKHAAKHGASQGAQSAANHHHKKKSSHKAKGKKH